MFPKTSLHTLFPTVHFTEITAIDMSVTSDFFKEDPLHENLELAREKIAKFQNKYPTSLLANGYLEERAFYNTTNFERTLGAEKEYRNIHLGTDFWLPENTPVHAPFDGTVVIAHDNDYHKDYGPLLVVEHKTEATTFYTLYGHLSKDSLTISPKGKKVKQGELLAYLGNEEENGHWVSHLHFQLITDLLNETENYNGVAFPSEIEKWKKLCPNPSELFEEEF